MSRIVIIGGMGPQASLILHQRIITAAARAGAHNNEDYPEILHASIPIPDFISSGDSTAGFKRLRQSLDKLHFEADDQVVLACNTAHLLLPKIEAMYGLEFSSLIQATAEAVKKSGAQQVGLLASPTTIKSGLYGKPLSETGCEVLLPTHAEIALLEQAIRHIIAGGSAKVAHNLVEPIVQQMISAGAAGIILGCTELSVICNGDSREYIFDPLAIICQKLVKTPAKPKPTSYSS